MSERMKIFEYFDKYKDSTAERVKDGIEKYRKGDLTIKITGADKKPVKNAEITLKQKKHEFKHGANIFMLDEFDTEEKNEAYKNYFAKAFNMATLPFYWNATEPEEGKTRYDKNSCKLYRRPPIDLCIEFCEKHGIEPREHGLAYEHFFPDWLKDASVDEIKKHYEKRCKEISERYADKIRTIEVTNEHHWFKGNTAFYEEDDFVEYCYKVARKYFPKNQLGINDFSAMWSEGARIRNRFYMLIEKAIASGAEIDAVGMQYHMFHREEDDVSHTPRTYNPEHLFGVLDAYSRLNLPIQITEVTIPAYNDTKEGEEIQARLIKELYSVWFSHKSVEQIIYWNLPDGYAAFAPQGDMTAGENYYRGGLLRYDLSPKPAYNVIYDLFHNEWITNEKISSDCDGFAKVHGFYGDYDVQIKADGKCINSEIKFSKKGENEFSFSL